MVASLFSSFQQCGGIKDIEHGLIWDGGTLEVEVSKRAAILSKLGIGPRSIVATAHGGTAHFFADLFALWRVGAAAACLDPALTRTELRNVIRFAAAQLLLVDSKSWTGDDIGIPIFDLNVSTVENSMSPLTAFDPDAAALVLFTSGTTGSPKGVVLSFRALQARIKANIEAIGCEILQRTLVTLPTHFGHGLIGNALTPLAAGGQIVLPSNGEMTRHLAHIIDSHHISFMSSVPALWQRATRQAQPSHRTLRRVHIGSAPLSMSLWSDVVSWSRAEVVNCYGMTETANWVAGASSRDDGIGQGLVGRSWGTRVVIKDDRGVIRDLGAGELLVHSPALMSGYLDRPELTATTFYDGWFHTGDYGKVDAQGRIWLTGRIKDEINRAGFKVQPAEIDILLESHPKIAEACVFGVADPVSGEVVVAAIRLESGEELVQQELTEWCLERLRREAVPEQWFMVSSIPRNARGKVSRDAVRQMLVPSSDRQLITGKTQEADPRTTLVLAPELSQRILQAVEHAWVEAFGERSLALNDSWDKAGGDSLDVLRLLFSIEAELDTHLTFDVLKPGAGRDAVADAVAEMLGTAPADASIDAPLVFFFPPLEGDMPHIASFRKCFGSRFRFAVVQYPTWREMIDAGKGFDTLVNSAASQIRARSEHGPFYFFCCSSGGFVAWETARRLVQSGEEIGFLGLIDARRNTEPRQPRQTSIDIVDGSSTDLLSLTHQLRRDALRNSTIAPLQIAATLFRTAPSIEGATPWLGPLDYGWSELCPDLTIVNVEGSHSTIFHTPNDEFLGRRMIERMEAAVQFPGLETSETKL